MLSDIVMTDIMNDMLHLPVDMQTTTEVQIDMITCHHLGDTTVQEMMTMRENEDLLIAMATDSSMSFEANDCIDFKNVVFMLHCFSLLKYVHSLLFCVYVHLSMNWTLPFQLPCIMLFLFHHS